MSRFLSLTIALLLPSFAFGQQSQSQVEKRTQPVNITSTDKSLFFVKALVEVSADGSQVLRIAYRSCISGKADEADLCTTIGRSSGYTLAELEARESALRSTKAMRTAARIAFPVAGAIIGGTNGWKRGIVAGKGASDITQGFAIVATPFYALVHGSIGAALGYGASTVILKVTEDANSQSEALELAKKAGERGLTVVTDMSTPDLLLNLNIALAGIR